MNLELVGGEQFNQINSIIQKINEELQNENYWFQYFIDDKFRIRVKGCNTSNSEIFYFIKIEQDNKILALYEYHTNIFNYIENKLNKDPNLIYPYEDYLYDATKHI